MTILLKWNILLKNIIIILLVSTFPLILYSQQTYYVSSSMGDDGYDGLSGEHDGIHGPWRTISRVHSASFNPGDSILFKRGDSWRENLIIYSSGDENSLITYSAYGGGECPEINCSDKINGWELYNESFNIWKAKIDPNISSISQVFVDGERQTVVRWPNNGWNIIDKTSSDGYFLIDAVLNQPDNYWKGSTLVIRSCLFNIEEKEISSSSAGESKLQWESALSYGMVATKDYGYYIENNFNELDTLGEYYFDKQDHSLYIVLEAGTTPDDKIIEASVRANGIYCNEKNYINIDGMKVEKAAEKGFLCYNSNHLKILQCTFSNCNKNGINFYSSDGNDLILNGNVVNNIDQGRAISIINIRNTEIVNNEITNVAVDLSSPRNGGGIYLRGSSNTVIKGNTLSNIGSHGIHVADGPVSITKNMMSNCSFIVQDNGAIYLNGDHSKSVIDYNWIQNCIGSYRGTPYSEEEPGSTVGLYSDETCFGATFQYNVVINCSYGIHAHKSHNTNIFNNVFYNNRISGISLQERATNQMYGNKIYNNISFALNSSYALMIRRFNSSDYSIADFDNNVYYNPDKSECIAYLKGVDASYFSLLDWQSKLVTDSENDKFSLSVNPQFVDELGADFHLNSKSSCIDSGIYIGCDFDFDNQMVPFGSKPDIGAFEYGYPTHIYEHEIFDSNFIRIFPNPAKQKISIKFHVTNHENVNIMIYNVLGNKIDEINMNSLFNGEHIFSWDKKDNPTGIYSFKISIGQDSKGYKILFVD